MMKVEICQNNGLFTTSFIFKKHNIINLFGFTLLLIGFIGSFDLIGAQTTQSSYYSPTTQAPPPPPSSYIKSNVFRQEIARFQINVIREGKTPLPITQVPRVQQGDVLKIKLLDEAVNGIKLDQSQWDWTFLVAFINPAHRMTETRDGKAVLDKTGTVSNEINFKKQGWYKEYSFTVPYDSQPVFFLYPRPKYRKQLMKVVSGKYEEIRKLGEKTIELADAYSQIDSFLGELQVVLNRNAQTFGHGYGTGNNTTGNSSTSPYNSSNPSSTYNPSSGYPYNTYNPYGSTTTTTNQPLKPDVPIFGLNTIPALNQIVEGLAKSFNINLPSCWSNGYTGSNGSGYGSSFGGYNSYGSSGGYSNYNSGYSGYGGYSGYSSYGNNNQVLDFVSRAQCVAKQVNLQDFDVSVTRMWQQGGVFLAAELQKKYPQIAYWINIAAAAIDFIVKVFQKSPLRIVPTIIQASDGQSNSYGVAGSYQNNYNPGYQGSTYSGNSATSGNSLTSVTSGIPVKISLFADSQPAEGQFVTAYPIVVHKWQANPDLEVISLYPPLLTEPCLHIGTNLLKSTDLTDQFSQDTYSRDFRLVLSSENGFKKELPLRKNIGLSGWELNLTAEDLNQIPKINMTLEAELVGTRGFNDIRSPKFNLPIPLGGSYEITPESQKNFAVGGRRTITLRNSLGSCRCLQSVIYKPSFGGQFVYEAGSIGSNIYNSSPNNLSYSSDGREVSFEIDATNFQPGVGTIEVKTYGGDSQNLQVNQATPLGSNNLTLKLYPAPPIISDIKAGRGDREILITGERLDQINTLNINGKRAIIKGNNAASNGNTGVGIYGNNYTANNPNQNQNNYSNQTPIKPTTPVNPPPISPSAIASQYQNLSPNQRVAVFEDATSRITADSLTIELGLEDNRNVIYPNKFAVGASRPSIKVNDQNEIEGTFLSQTLLTIKNDQVIVTPELSKTKGQKSRLQDHDPQIELSSYPVVSIDKNAMTLVVQNILTDYSFRNENLSIETRIENATTNPNELPNVKFNVLDTNNLRLNFTFNQSTNKSLSGRRLQFRIRDRERGDSNWYSIKQTFVRLPEIESVKCTTEINNQCALIGEGLDFIAQVSVDGGRSWNSNNLQVQVTEDGKTKIMIPLLINQKFLQIKLRDYPNTDGLTVTGFVYSNTKINKP